MTAAMPLAAPLDELSAQLSDRFGNRWLTSPSRRANYATSEGHHGGTVPDLVVQPTTIAEVQAIVAAAANLGIAMVPYGVGTSLEGNAAVGPGALCIDLSSMNRILAIAPEDLLCVVEPGVTREQLNDELRATGLFFPIDPGANATLGGMISTRASGTNAVRYGTMRENTLALKVVLPDGSLIQTGTRARKSAAGYDLTHLMVGAEGTLGLVVEATIKLHGRPEAVLSGSWPFATLEGAVETVIAIIQAGSPVARLELLDTAAVVACNRHDRLSMPEQPHLFVELHGSPASINEQHHLLAAIGDEFGGGALALSADPGEQKRLWTARYHALPAARALVAGASVWTSDICVPISQLAHAIAVTHRAIAEQNLVAPIVGHVGDGNYHVLFVLPPDDPSARDRAAAVNERMIDFALSVGGTCTGEHGIGIGKRHALLREHGHGAVALMRSIKSTIDPNGLMNPGKIFI